MKLRGPCLCRPRARCLVMVSSTSPSKRRVIADVAVAAYIKQLSHNAAILLFLFAEGPIENVSIRPSLLREDVIPEPWYQQAL